MFRKVLIAISLTILSVTPAFADKAQKYETNAGVNTYILKNGMKVILAPYSSAPDITVILTVNTGSKREGYGESGMAHLLEHMLFKRTPTRPDLKASLTALGAKWNGTTTADRTDYFETFKADHETLDEVLAIEADRLMNASFTRDDLASEMTVVRNELERNANNPNHRLMTSVMQTAWHWHGYGRTTIGEVSDIEGAPFENLQAFYKKHYRPDNSFLVISGKFDNKKAMQLVDKHFSTLKNPSTPKPDDWTKEPPQLGPRHITEHYNSGKVMTMHAWKTPPAYTDEYVKLDAGISAIFAVPHGKLYKELVLEKKKAISVGGGTWGMRDGGMVIASATLENAANAKQFEEELNAYIEEQAKSGITEEMLERIKTESKNAYLRLVNDAGEFGRQLANNEVLGDWRLYFSQQDILDSLTSDEINTVLKKWIVSSNRTSATLIPEAITPVIVPPFDPKQMKFALENKHWNSVIPVADQPETSLEKLNGKVKTFNVGDLKVALVKRKTSGNRVWIDIIRNFGTKESLSNRRTACNIAGALIQEGAAGMSADAMRDFANAYDATISLDMGSVRIDVISNKLEPVLKQAVQWWISPDYPAVEFEKYRKQQLESIKTAKTEPSSVAANRTGLYMTPYTPEHPYRTRTFEESEAALNKVTLDDVKTCFNMHRGTSNIRVGITGDISEAEVHKLLSDNIPKVDAEVNFVRIKKQNPSVEGTVISEKLKDRPNTVIIGTLPLEMNDNHELAPALRMANNILGSGSQSRLWQTLREKHGLSYSADASLSYDTFDEVSSLTLKAIANNKNSSKALGLMQHELQNMVDRGITEAELTRARTQFMKNRALTLANESQYSSTIADALYTGRTYKWVSEYDKKIMSLTVQDVNQAIKAMIDPSKVVWSLAGGEE